MVDFGSVAPSVAGAVVTAAVSYTAWVARQARIWLKEHTERTLKNETRSHANRRMLDSVVDQNAENLPPADDPAEKRLGEIDHGGDENGR